MKHVLGNAFAVSAVFALVAATPTWSADSADGRITFEDVFPILQENCQVCHRPGGDSTAGMVAPMSLMNYRETRPWAKVIAKAVAAKDMPPWDATSDTHGVFINERSLTDTEPVSVCRACVQQEDDPYVDSQFDEPQFDAQQTPDQPDKKSIYAQRVIDERNIWIMNSITRDVIKYGTGRRARVLKRQDMSGKTGTTNDQRDAWFNGFNANIVGVAWVGFDKFQPLGSRETGARAALPIWVEYMKTALEDLPESMEVATKYRFLRRAQGGSP